MTDTWLHTGHRNAPCTIIAEVAQAHDGSLGTAHAFIDAIAQSGADAVKFQTHIAAAESTALEPWRKPFSTQDRSRFDYWRRMEFSLAQWHELKAHAIERGLLFLSSPFSPEAIELLDDVGVAAWKIASGETSNPDMLKMMLRSDLPIILSTGLDSFSEIDIAVARLKNVGVPYALLQCTSAYPCPAERIGLNVIEEFRNRYGCAVGLSDHSATIFPGVVAASLGIQVLEVHITLSRHMFGPDVVASITPRQLSALVDGVRFAEKMRNNPVDKTKISEAMQEMRNIFGKSAVASRDLPAGTRLRREHISAKKPGHGIRAEKIPKLIGKRLLRDIKADSVFDNRDFE